MNSISLKMWQNNIIIDLLRKSDGNDEESLLVEIISSAQVSREIADAYRLSWRYNHRQGAIAAIAGAVNAENPTKEEKPSAKMPRQIIITNNTENDIDLPLEEGEGKVQAILRLHRSGMSNDQIIASGFNKSTVYRQVSEYKKRVKAEKELAKA